MDQKLQQAVRTLRAIRQRYEAGRNADFGFVRTYSVQVALGYADMRWITAAIEVLEKEIAPSSNEGPRDTSAHQRQQQPYDYDYRDQPQHPSIAGRVTQASSGQAN